MHVLCNYTCAAIKASAVIEVIIMSVWETRLAAHGVPSKSILAAAGYLPLKSVLCCAGIAGADETATSGGS